jgi:hypothetical protein
LFSESENNGEVFKLNKSKKETGFLPNLTRKNGKFSFLLSVGFSR